MLFYGLLHLVWQVIKGTVSWDLGLCRGLSGVPSRFMAGVFFSFRGRCSPAVISLGSGFDCYGHTKIVIGEVVQSFTS